MSRLGWAIATALVAGAAVAVAAGAPWQVVLLVAFGIVAWLAVGIAVYRDALARGDLDSERSAATVVVWGALGLVLYGARRNKLGR